MTEQGERAEIPQNDAVEHADDQQSFQESSSRGSRELYNEPDLIPSFDPEFSRFLQRKAGVTEKFMNTFHEATLVFDHFTITNLFSQTRDAIADIVGAVFLKEHRHEFVRLATFMQYLREHPLERDDKGNLQLDAKDWNKERQIAWFQKYRRMIDEWWDLPLNTIISRWVNRERERAASESGNQSTHENRFKMSGVSKDVNFKTSKDEQTKVSAITDISLLKEHDGRTPSEADAKAFVQRIATREGIAGNPNYTTSNLIRRTCKADFQWNGDWKKFPTVSKRIKAAALTGGVGTLCSRNSCRKISCQKL